MDEKSVRKIGRACVAGDDNVFSWKKDVQELVIEDIQINYKINP
jgi:hypothetical protein